MRRILWLSAVGLFLGLGQLPAWSTDIAASTFGKEATSCGEFGTSISFEPNPSAAARKALKDEKLVLVLHISGIFEDPGLT